mmetsp:Transcript_81801/g.147719  ORF Transcript_81801/g.147719 Transcript_81801/m.147719 type:complete len:148 (-) Transcript_81801:269-712(-)
MNVCTALMLLASLGHANADSIFRETFSAATCADDVKKYDKYYYTEKCTKVDDKSYTKAWCDDRPRLPVEFTYFEDEGCTVYDLNRPTEYHPMACTEDEYKAGQWNKFTCTSISIGGGLASGALRAMPTPGAGPAVAGLVALMLAFAI